MKTVRVALDESLAEEVDRAAKPSAPPAPPSPKTLSATQSDVSASGNRSIDTGYEKKPVQRGEVRDWEDEQVWGD